MLSERSHRKSTVTIAVRLPGVRLGQGQREEHHAAGSAAPAIQTRRVAPRPARLR